MIRYSVTTNLTRRFLAAAFSGFFVAATANYSSAEDIDFPVQTMSGETIEGTGELAIPDGADGKMPLVILVHGTRGVGYREDQWSDYLSEQGFATFKLDYFSPRGVSGRGRNIPRPPEDVWGALKVLAANPQIDASKIAVMGFSNGGSVTRSSAELDPGNDTNGIVPKAYIMVYGGCHTPISLHSTDYQPALLYIVGSEDKLVTAETCSSRKNDSNSKDLDVMVIDGAYHMFDGNTSKKIRHRKWGEVELRADSGATESARNRVRQLLNRVFE